MTNLLAMLFPLGRMMHPIYDILAPLPAHFNGEVALHYFYFLKEFIKSSIVNDYCKLLSIDAFMW